MNAMNPIQLPGKSFDLNTFTYNGHKLRVVLIDGKPWFVGKDVARAIGQQRGSVAKNVRAIVDSTEVLVLERSRACSEIQNIFESTVSLVLVVTESGLYKLIMRAQRSNPAAREFQDWVTKEVLPRIRRDGAYIMGEEKVATGRELRRTPQRGPRSATLRNPLDT